ADEGACNDCGHGSKKCCGTHRLCGICGHKMSELPVLINPACYGYFATQWQPWPCPTPEAEPEKQMPKEENSEPPVKPAVRLKGSKILTVQPAVRSLPDR